MDQYRRNFIEVTTHQSMRKIDHGLVTRSLQVRIDHLIPLGGASRKKTKSEVRRKFESDAKVQIPENAKVIKC